jgi:YebC/PmpR family DNA-binding regulatory protein
MSGHSKWATIKRKKAATDQARGKMFSKYIKEITLAARHGGGDPDANPRLRTAIAAAKSVNMPAANIDRAVKRGTGEVEGVHYEETQYEGYGPGGAAILVEVATDNRNRTTGDVRHIFTKFGGKLGEAGSVAHLFKPTGLIVIERAAVAEDTLMEAALEAGADDVLTEGEVYEVLTPPHQLEAV